MRRAATHVAALAVSRSPGGRKRSRVAGVRNLLVPLQLSLLDGHTVNRQQRHENMCQRPN